MPDPADSLSRFTVLLAELCQELGLQAPEAEFPAAAGEGAQLDVEFEGTCFELAHDPRLPGLPLLVTTHLGAAPEDEESLLGLLHANLDVIRQTGATFAWDAGAGGVTHCQALPLDSVHPAELADHLREMAQCAWTWRSGEMFRAAAEAPAPAG